MRPLLACALAAVAALAPAAGRASDLIDRREVVTRHHPVVHGLDVESPLSVGNGEIAFTADATGLKTFAELYDDTIPLATLSQWAWHSFPNPKGWSIERFHFNEFESHGRRVGCADIPGDHRTAEIDWLRGNPHRLHLGRIGFDLRHEDGRRAGPSDLEDVEQTLDLWNGALRSRFRLDGEPVEVVTVCHPDRDVLAVRVRSALVARGRVAIEIAYPYGTGATSAADWSRPGAHQTRMIRVGEGAARFDRRLDADSYAVGARWTPGGALREAGPHHYRLEPGDGDSFELVVGFAPDASGTATLPGFGAVWEAATRHWNRFWQTGAAIDLSGSTDPRWRELERRVVLSSYLTAIQCAGTLPPQETSLTFNSWEGKFHLEMYWWHSVQFALWGRLPLLERSHGAPGGVRPPRPSASRSRVRG